MSLLQYAHANSTASLAIEQVERCQHHTNIIYTTHRLLLELRHKHEPSEQLCSTRKFKLLADLTEYR